MTTTTKHTSERVGEPTATPTITDKRGYAAHWHFSVRKVSDLLAQGLPHIKISARQLRINIQEADAWMHEQFHTQRRAKQHEAKN
jgi:hypothetical protein